MIPCYDVIELYIYTCRGCERSDVTKHMLVHETPKLSCEICSKTFRHQKNKDLHMKRYAVPGYSVLPSCLALRPNVLVDVLLVLRLVRVFHFLIHDLYLSIDSRFDLRVS